MKIFVSTGTLPLPFSRLINTIIDFYQLKKNHQVIIQTGIYQPPKTPPHIICKPFIDFKLTIKYYQTCDLIISAAGEASVFLILKYSKNTPLFMPRLKKFQEHVDNKQLATCQYLKKHQLASIAITPKQLEKRLSLLKTKCLNSFKKPKPSSSTQLNHLVKKLHSITNS